MMKLGPLDKLEQDQLSKDFSLSVMSEIAGLKCTSEQALEIGNRMGSQPTFWNLYEGD